MNTFKQKLLYKYLNGEYLNNFEKKKFIEYLNKINIFTYCKYEDEPHFLNSDYIKWCKIKINFLNKELYKEYNNVVASTSRINNIKNNLDANKESKT